MLIVALNGSAQKEGNTTRLLARCIEVAESYHAQARLVHVAEVLQGLKIPFCYQCSDPCRGNCSRNNQLGETLDLLRQADGLILGSPVHFGSVSGQLKAFWDKTRILRTEKALLNVPGIGVVVGISRFGGQENTLTSLQQMMLVQGMTVVGDGYQEGDCGHHGICAQQPVEDDLEVWKRIPIAVQRLLATAKVSKDLRNSTDLLQDYSDTARRR